MACIMSKTPAAASQSEQEPSFEQSLAQLEAIVKAIEEGKIGLEDSITQYETGMKLILHCRAVLANAEAKVQQLNLGQDGKLTPGPMPSTE